MLGTLNYSNVLTAVTYYTSFNAILASVAISLNVNERSFGGRLNAI